MTTTPNLHLPQWEKTDRIMMDDFNDAMSKIDAVCGGTAKFAAGHYIGDGAAARTISLPFTPKFVLLCGYYHEGSAREILAFITQDVGRGFVNVNGALTIRTATISLVENGFRCDSANCCNSIGMPQDYIAIG